MTSPSACTPQLLIVDVLHGKQEIVVFRYSFLLSPSFFFPNCLLLIARNLSLAGWDTAQSANNGVDSNGAEGTDFASATSQTFSS